MTSEQERECIKIAYEMHRTGRFTKYKWRELVEIAMTLYRNGVRFKD